MKDLHTSAHREDVLCIIPDILYKYLHTSSHQIAEHEGVNMKDLHTSADWKYIPCKIFSSVRIVQPMVNLFQGLDGCNT